MMDTQPVVEFRGVSKAFGDRRVLDDLSLSVDKGRSVCILGRSGPGKSVTLRQMIGLLPPDKGDPYPWREHHRTGRRRIIPGPQEREFLFQ